MRLLPYLSVTLPILLLWILSSASASAQDDDVLFEADKVIQNQRENILDAIGNVQLTWRDYLLSADWVRYFQNERIVHARGHGLLVQPDETLIFARSFRLTDNFQYGDIEHMAILLQDESRITARVAKRDESPLGLGRRNQMRRATYSACKVCADKKNYPLWQISAEKITHFEKSKTIYYRNMFLEFFGIPVFYLPFFSHPEPSVERRTGFLIPRPSYSRRLGFRMELPFTIDFSPQTNFILTPTFTSKQGALVELEWKHLTSYGQYNLSTSVAHDYDKQPNDKSLWPKTTRGHLFSNGDFPLGDAASFHYQAEWVSDDIYLDLFSLSSKKELNSNVLFYREGDGLSLSLESYYLQDLLNREPDLFVLPHISLAARPSLLGGEVIAKTSLLALLRSEAVGEDDREDMLRLSGEFGWQDRWIIYGQALHFYGSTRFDYYQNTYSDDSRQNLSRILPLLALEWRFPFIRQDGRTAHLIEPVAQLIYTPDQTIKPVPEETSQGFYFSDSNVLSVHRFADIDRWESGPRANLGLSWEVNHNHRYYSELFLGKVFRLEPSPDFDENTGLEARDSDIVARWNVFFPFGDLTQSARFDRRDMSLKRYDGDIGFSFDALRFFTGYTYLPEPEEDQEIHAGADIRLIAGWRGYGKVRYNLTDDRSIHNQLGFSYQDECFKMDLNFNHRETQDGQREWAIGFRLTLKNLGTVDLSSQAGSDPPGFNLNDNRF